MERLHMSKATTKKPPKKPAKPYPDFPLFAHQSGRWCKKIKQRFHYFGPLSDPDKALERYLETKDDLYAGRTPRPKGDSGGLTLLDLCNHFLTMKERRMESGELGVRMLGEYHATCERILETFGRRRLPTDLIGDDFAKYRAELARRLGPVALGNEIQRVRSIFKHAFENALIAAPVRFGTEFAKPSRRTIRVHKSSKPQRMFSAADIRKLLKISSDQVKAMILLGVNCGFGNGDTSSLPMSSLDLSRGVVDFARPKSGIERRATLWPETVRALRTVIANRSDPKADEDKEIVFLTKYGHRWVRHTQTKREDAVGHEFAKLLTAAKMKRAGVGFYALRHTFKTIADETRDIPAVNRIMGHHDPSIGATYREWSKDARENARLKAVTDHVRGWLFPRGKKK